MKNLIAVGCALMLIGVSLRANAATVVARTGPSAGSLAVSYQFGPDSVSSILAVGWSQTLGFTDVNISAPLAASAAGYSGTAYVTTKLGPGTTTADQIAASNFNFPVSSSTPYADLPL